MAVLGRLLLGSAERLDLPDLLSIDSYTAADFKYLLQSFVGSDKPFILKGFDVIQPQDAIGAEAVSIRVADSVVFFPDSGAGSFYYGLPEGTLGTEPLIPELRKNATNYIYVNLTTFDSAEDSRAFWDPDQNGGEGGEFSQDVNTQTVLSVEVGVSVATFPEGAVPIAKVVVGPAVIESIQDCRDMMFRLGSGGVTPDPFRKYEFRDEPSSEYSRSEPSSFMSDAFDPNPFQGGDKNIHTLKEWMDAVMTRLKEISGDTYWYSEEGTSGSGPNISDTWHDSLGSTLVSKGQFSHDESIGGRVIWDEDVYYKNLTDPRQLVIRASTIDIADDDEVAFIEMVRDADINTTSTAVSWQNGLNYVNGTVGAFENLSKGDWVKKKSDSHPFYLRVEEFYDQDGLTGSTTSPALARSIKLSANYAGTSAVEGGDYTKGEYLQTDIQVAARDDASIHQLGGNFFWLAFRSDVVTGLQSITYTQLSIDISQADGVRARVTSVGHGLIDQDRITITTGAYAGTYQVEVEDADNFFINTSTTGDESGQTAFYAIVETAARQTDDGFDLESAATSLQPNQRVFIENTATPYDGSYLANPRSATSFQIAYDATTPDPGPIDGEIVRVIKVNVKTEFGVVKVIQGESVDIGDIDSQNILSYIGMGSLAETKPTYNTPNDYNALDGHANFNASEDDDLTTRAAKLTAMMADRVQERGFGFRGRVNITSVTNGANQDVSANGTITLHKPSSPEQVIDLTVSLPPNSAAVANIDRDGSAPITLVVESLGNDYLLEENKYIMFYRFSDQTVYTWEDVAIEPSGHFNFGLPDDSSNRNIVVFNPGQIKLEPISGELTLQVSEGAETTRVTVTQDGASLLQSSYFTLNSAGDTNSYYVWFNIGGNGMDPTVSGKTGVPVAVSPGDDENAIASAVQVAVDALTDISASVTDNVVTITNDAPGSAENSQDGGTGFNIVVLCDGNDPDIEIFIPGSSFSNTIDVDAINALGTLVIPDGAAAWVRVNRFAEKTFNTIQTSDLPDTDANGSIYITAMADVPEDQDVFVLWSRTGDSMFESHKAARPDGNVYEEFVDIVPDIPANMYEIQGPLASGTEIILPPDSRDSDNSQHYMVGAGQLQVYLRGQLLRKDKDWEEVGIEGCLSSRIRILQDLEISDELGFRIDAHGAVYFASDGVLSTSLQDAYDAGRFINVNTGQPIVITGASGKLMSLQGDVEITGVIDPAAITFSPQTASPITTILDGVDQIGGHWFKDTGEMVVESFADDTTITNESGNLILKAESDTLILDSATQLNGDLDMNGQLLKDLTGPVQLGSMLDLNGNVLTSNVGSVRLGTDLDLETHNIVSTNLNTILINGTLDNFFVGQNAGSTTATGQSNTALGSESLTSIITGSANTAVGRESLTSLTGGDQNTAVGFRSLFTGETNSNNTALGFGALYLSTGDDNTAVGHDALVALTTGAENTALGKDSAASLTTGSQSLFLGALSDTTEPTLDNQIALGYGAIVDAANKMRVGNDNLTSVEFAPGVTLSVPSGAMSLESTTTLSLTSQSISLVGSITANSNRITQLGTPQDDADAVTKLYVDDGISSLTNSIQWKQSVKAHSDGDIDVSTGGLLTVDGITLDEGDRVLLSGQSITSQNGIYIASSGPWVRSEDLDTGTSAANIVVTVESGTDYADTGWICTADAGSDVVGTDGLAFNKFGGSAEQSDAEFLIFNAIDETKIATFNAGTISTGTTRVYNLPDADGTLATLDDITPADRVQEDLTPAEVLGSGVRAVRYGVFQLDFPENIGEIYNADKTAESLVYSVGNKDPFFVIGLCDSDNTLNPQTVVKSGLFVAAHGLTRFGEPVYLGASGTVTQDPPTAAGEAVVRLGIVKSSTEIEVNISVVGVN